MRDRHGRWLATMVLLASAGLVSACTSGRTHEHRDRERAPVEDGQGASTDESVSYLVWNQWSKRDGSYNYETVWIMEDDLGRGVLGEVDSLVFAAGDRVLTWEATESEFESGNCEGGTQRFTDWSGSLVLAGEDRAITVHEPIGGRSKTDYETFRRTLSTTGNIGPYFFVRRTLERRECNDERSVNESFATVIDLRNGAEVDLSPELSAEAWEEVVSVVGRSMQRKPTLVPYVPTSPKDIRINELVPEFGADGMEVELLVGVDTCHSCSKSEAGSGTWTTRLPHETPEVLREHLELPDMVGDRFKGFARGWQFGFTVVQTEAARAQLRKVFSNPEQEPQSIRPGRLAMPRRGAAKADSKMAEPR